MLIAAVPTPPACHAPSAAASATIGMNRAATGRNSLPVLAPPTQVRRPWRSTARTIFQATIALAAMWALIVQTLGLPDWAWVGTSVAVAGGITRLMALPQVEVFLRHFLPWLAAAPKPQD